MLYPKADAEHDVTGVEDNELQRLYYNGSIATDLQRICNGSITTALFKVETFSLITTHTPYALQNELPHLSRRYRRHVHHRMWLQHSAPDLQFL